MGRLGVRWGHAAGTGVQSLDDLRRQAAWAQTAGFDSFWLSQIFGVDPLVALAVIADDVPGFEEIGTSVVPLTGRHPLSLAAAALTTQAACGGRFTLGIGPSHQMVAEGFFGESYARPYSRTREFVGALTDLFETGSTSTTGEEIFASGWLTIDAPPVPIMLAALGPRMLRLAGERTAGTSLGSCGPKTIAEHVVPILTAAAESADRPPPRVMALVGVCITDQPDRRRAANVESGTLYDNLPSYRAVLDREGVGLLIKLAVEKGRACKPKIKLGICGEHGGEPKSVAFCHEIGLDYVSCSPFRVPVARLAAAHAQIREEQG